MKKFRLRYIYLHLGFTSLLAQVLLLRELVILGAGNELTFGLALGSWLFWTALGSYISGQGWGLKNPIKRLEQIVLLLIILLPLEILLIRWGRNVLSLSSGEMLGWLPLIIFCLLLLAPLCLLIGYGFSASVYATQSSNKISDTSHIAGLVYIMEALGAGIGGILFYFVWLGHFSPLQMSLLTGLIGLILQLFYSKLKLHLLFVKIRLLLILLCLSLLFTPLIAQLEFISRGWSLHNLELKANEESPYGNLIVTQQEEQISFYENGTLIFSTPNLLYAEEIIHYPLLQIQEPENILLIGGGCAGLLEQIIQYPSIKNIDYIELDSTLISLSSQFISDSILKHSDIQIIYGDGRRYLQTTKNKYDAIIISLPDPSTAQLNRFYTSEFFEIASEHLTQKGVFALSVSSSENYLSQELSSFLACISKTLEESFTEIAIVPGETAYFLASDNFLTLNADTLSNRLKKLDLELYYIREYYLPYKLSVERIKYIKEQINRYIKDIRINYDLQPICYFYNTILWSRHFVKGKPSILIKIAKLPLIIYFIPLFLIFIILLFFLHSSKIAKRNSINFSIIAIGLSEIALEIIILLAFQIFYGYVYSKLSIILAMFMIGLALGGWGSNNRFDNKSAWRWLIIIQASMMLYCLLLIPILKGLQHLSGSSAIAWLFPLLSALAGFMAGWQFPLANQLNLIGLKKEQTGSVAGTLYASDLLGSFVGALIISIILIPLVGLLWTLLWLAILNAIAFVGLIIVRHS